VKKFTGTAIFGFVLGFVNLLAGQNAAYAAGLANTGQNAAQNAMLLSIGGGIVLIGAAAIIFVAVRRRNAAKRDD